MCQKSGSVEGKASIPSPRAPVQTIPVMTSMTWNSTLWKLIKVKNLCAFKVVYKVIVVDIICSIN